MPERQIVTSGMLDLDKISAKDMLLIITDMFDNAPPNSKPYLDVAFEDTWGQRRAMRMRILGEKHDHNVH